MHPIDCIQRIELFRDNLKLKRYEGITDGELKATWTVQHREHPRSTRRYLEERRTQDMNQFLSLVCSLSGRGQWQNWCAFLSHLPTILPPENITQALFQDTLPSFGRDSMSHSSSLFWPIASGVVVHHVTRTPSCNALTNPHNIHSTNTLRAVTWRSSTRYNTAEFSSY